MSWASRRKTIYLSSIIGVFVLLMSVPLTIWLYEPASCFDGERNQGETAVDRGGPCKLLDERSLVPYAVLWSRSFSVRDGMHNAVAYIENPNPNAGVSDALYRFRLYDEENLLVAEREGTIDIMPGAITPIFESDISTGNREVARTFFEFAGPLTWERLTDRSHDVAVENKRTRDIDTRPRITARVVNESVRDMRDLILVAVAFDAAGNAFAASRTVIPLLPGDEQEQVTFTWPEPFDRQVARVDVLPVIPPVD